MSLLTPRVLLVCIAALPAAACAEGMGGPIYQGMDGAVDGEDGGGSSGDSSGGPGVDPTGGTNTGVPQCMAASGTCAAPTVFPNFVEQADKITQIATVMGDTTLQCSVIAPGSCLSGGPENVYLLTMPINGKLTLALQAGLDPAVSQWPASVYVTNACGDIINPLLACQTATVGMPWAPLALGMPFAQGQKLFVHVDGADLNAKGLFTLTATVVP